MLSDNVTQTVGDVTQTVAETVTWIETLSGLDWHPVRPVRPVTIVTESSCLPPQGNHGPEL